ncbi:hypothetical protein NSQ20_12515 [Paenibacillus sp. FSL K6-1122]|uniref:hypothetical protein n=1 Tax=Paenibacillus sp. FSL K6-1122 TaxID=2954512 RepID=UPI0030EF0226
MDESVIPKGMYCYDEKGYCPYSREDKKYKYDAYGYGNVSSTWCDYLKLNSAQLDFEGRYEKDGSKCYLAHLIYDLCKVCEVNK